jgi:hypothetical protein
MISGPAAVRFSAPRALATTVTFTDPGTYTFQLAASNGTSTGTSDVTVSVKSASSQTAFYVDPTYTGGGSNGSSTKPWTRFDEGDPSYPNVWTAINSALATNDVIVYFPARVVASDTPASLTIPTGGEIFINRHCAAPSYTCASADTTLPHRLTIDGMSVYTTSDSSPNWVTYTGTNKFKIACGTGASACGGQAIGWADQRKRDYITIRGFEITGGGARLNWGGSHTTIEYVWSHDVTTIGAQVTHQGAFNDCACSSQPGGCPNPLACPNRTIDECQPLGISHDITVRNNLIQRGVGEGLYIAGTYQYTQYGGCPERGNTHYDILIEGNTINDPGSNGEEGDGMDLKMGLHEMTVRNNTITNLHNSCEGGAIADSGVFQPSQSPAVTQPTFSNHLFEGNLIHGPNVSTGYCGVGGNTMGGIAMGAQWGTVVRNNLIYAAGPGGSGIMVVGDATYNSWNVAIYNNTIYNAPTGVMFGFTQHATLKNNLIFGNGTGRQIQNGGANVDINGDYNLLAPSGSDFTEGSHSIVFPSTAGIVVSTTTPDLHLSAGSPAIARGLNLGSLASLVVGYSSWITTFTNDFAGNGRQALPASWDIGAYVLGADAKPSAPQNLRIIR